MGTRNQERIPTDRQNLNQSQNNQKISLTTFTTVTHSHTHKSRDILILYFPSPWIIVSLRGKSQCMMGPHFTCNQ